ncbi:PLP-dependent transferase [Melanomma pulvis-pyrius CBS 109.77]|uniref:PLP-dependent transferase n=1 Tax=Melanomma pulvis-pyrius CBS 109.77 TaxID=1314802 RepID=A0A6A6X9E1_9PLEO|nr:PLP-dependent transferase [Melanomma pulvis-pyrius CBS 109.77]
MATSTPTTLAVREKKKFGKELIKDFLFAEGHKNLNHGSFGTYPRPVREAMHGFSDASEARPDDFIFYTYPKKLDESRTALAALLSVPVETLVFVPNATTGVNTVLRNLVYEEGDKILYFATAYGACEKTVVHLTETTPVQGVKIEFVHPVEDDWIVDQFRKRVKEEQAKGANVKVAMFDTVVSIPGVRMPFERLTAACKELGVLSLVDAAHGIGHIDLDLAKLDPDFLVSNCHKWLYVPRGCAVFHVPVRNQHLIRTTLPTSHGFNPLPVPGIAKIPTPVPSSGAKTAFIQNFEFMATIDNSPFLCIPAAIAYRESLGGEKSIMEYCNRLAREAGRRAAEILGTEVLENSTGTLGNCCMTNVRLPISQSVVEEVAIKGGIEKDNVVTWVREWMSKLLSDEYSTFIMIRWYAGAWWARFSGQVYLEIEDFEWGARVLKEVCGRVEKGEFLKEIASKL